VRKDQALRRSHLRVPLRNIASLPVVSESMVVKPDVAPSHVRKVGAFITLTSQVLREGNVKSDIITNLVASVISLRAELSEDLEFFIQVGTLVVITGYWMVVVVVGVVLAAATFPASLDSSRESEVNVIMCRKSLLLKANHEITIVDTRVHISEVGTTIVSQGS
jgi:hypothetical protein